MLASTLLVALGLSIPATIATHVERDTTESIGQLWAYGIGISGLPLWYGDGLAYIGTYASTNISSAANVTMSDAGSTVIAKVNKTTSVNASNIATTKLYIDRSEGAFSVAGFTATSSSSTTAKTSTGFFMYGTLLAWKSADGHVESNWYAEPVDNLDDVYQVYWNSADVDSSAIQIVIKNKGSS